MPSNLVRKLRVFAASPNDVAKHREALREVIDDLNKSVASDRGLVLEFVTWADVAGDMGRAEQIILDQIGEFDIFIGIMGHLTRFQKNQDTDGKIRSLLAFSWLCARKKLWERAATLLAAEEWQRNQRHLPTAPDWQREIKSINTGAKRSLGHVRYRKACAVARQMSLDQAVAYALRIM